MSVHPTPEVYARDRLAQQFSDYETDENHEMSTTDHEDHTFAGIMFTVECLDRAIRNVVIRGVSVRGELGPMTVWVARGRWHESRGMREDVAAWDCVFEGPAPPSFRRLHRLDLSSPVALEPGEVRSVLGLARSREPRRTLARP